ncbi:MAG TPA: tetratricopeptide repeat protein [Kiritimatiellia bacterium]|nr:tetratricopeptide repeat protein [Kiritimatiellia bacterium]
MDRLRILALLALVAVPYITALNHDFVYDDHGSIVENAYLQESGHIRDVLGLRTLTDLSVPDGRRPTVLLSYMADRSLWGLRPLGFHATSLLIHLCNTLLVLALARKFVAPGSKLLPFGTALLFGLHPVLIEAVQSPAFREDLLVTFFLLSYLLLATRRDTSAWFSAVPLILALLSKETAVIGPLLLFAIWFCLPALRPPTRRATGLAVYGIAAIFIFVGLWMASGPLQASGDIAYGTELRYPHNLLTLPYLWLKMLRIIIAPYPLVVDYVIRPVRSIVEPRFIAGALAVLASLTLFLALRRRQPLVALGLGWMMIAFVPASNMLPLYNPFAERYLYCVVPGFALAFASLLATPSSTRLRTILLACTATAYACLAILRLADWRTDLDLWSRAIQDQPYSARAFTWVGLEMKHQRDPRGAMLMFRAASALNPKDISPLINMAIIEGEDGRLAEAETLLREAVQRRPDKADAHWNLAVALQLQGKTNEAQAEITRTLEQDPRHPAALSVRSATKAIPHDTDKGMPLD